MPAVARLGICVFAREVDMGKGAQHTLPGCAPCSSAARSPAVLWGATLGLPRPEPQRPQPPK